jgi:hypothetical protein
MKRMRNGKRRKEDAWEKNKRPYWASLWPIDG